MVMSKCAKCQELDTTITIDGPSMLENVLKVVRDNMHDGTIVESTFWPKAQIRLNQPPFLSIPDTAPWPDVFEYYFECSNCGQLYRLAVETYHGSGGSWSPFEPTTRLSLPRAQD